MRKPRLPVLLVVGVVGATPSANVMARLTTHCNATNYTGVYIQVVDEAASATLGTVLIRPTDTEQQHALWNPMRAHRGYREYLGHYVEFYYPPEQDVFEIAMAMRDDPLLRSRGLKTASIMGGGCGGVFFPPQPGTQALTEYFDPTRELFALSTSAEESYALAGAGWRTTGQVIYTSPPGWGCGLGQVYRFQAPGVGSFYTSDPVECGGLRREGSGWRYDRVAFGAELPVDYRGQCPADAPQPVYRYYNDRAREGLPNHRYVIDPKARQEMTGRWIEEGVAFCVPPQP